MLFAVKQAPNSIIKSFNISVTTAEIIGVDPQLNLQAYCFFLII